MGKRIGHIDYRELSWDQNTSPLTKTPEGFLVGRVCLTGVGVFNYRQPDGSTLRVLRSHDEVVKSIASLNLKPITKLHPDEFVNAENAQKLQVGTVGNDVVFDGYNAYATITINSADAVLAVKSKELAALSCGYDCEREYTPGVWQGVEYDAIQRDIVYNHVALVEEGRAGDSVVLRVGVTDSMDNSSHKPKEAAVPTMKKLTLDGVEREAEAEVIVAFTKANDAAKDANAKLTGLNEQISKLQAERDALKEELKSAKTDDSAIQKAVDERVLLLDCARKHAVEVKDSKDVAGIQKALIGKAFPGMSLDGKDAAYLATAFDLAKNTLDSRQDSESMRQTQDSRNSITSMDSVEEARRKMDSGIYSNNKEGK
jgi:uncharacterized protein